MTEIIPITATARFHAAAHQQRITGFEANPEHIAKLLEVTDRTDVQVGSLALGSGIGWEVERARTPVYNAADTTLEDLGQPVEEPPTYRLNLPREAAITEAELSRQLTARLLATDRARNDMRRGVPGALTFGTGLVATPLGLLMYLNEASLSPETAAVSGGGATLLGVGIVMLRAYGVQGRQYDMAQFGAAPVLSPIIVHRDAKNTTVIA